MKVKVDVPAANGRKAYSYMREGGEGSAKPKSSGINKSAAAGLGAIAVGGLVAGGLAIASNSGASSPPKKTEVGGEGAEESLSSKLDRELEVIRKNLEKSGYWDEEGEGGGSSNSYRSQIAEMEAVKERERKNAEAFERRKASGEFNRPASVSTIAPSESGKNTGSAIAPPTAVTSKSSGKLADVIRKTKNLVSEGWERDRQAKGISSLKDNEYDVNQLANKAGQGTRSTLESVSNFANSFMQSFVNSKNTVEAKASEVKTTQKAIPSRIRRPNKTISKSIRKNSLECRIDSFVQSLRSKSCNTI